MKQSGINRRNFLQGMLAAGIVASTGWKWGGTLAWAQLPDDYNSLPWPDDGMGQLLPPRELGTGPRNDFPRIGIDENDTPWCLWVDHLDGIERLKLTKFVGNRFEEGIVINDSGTRFATHPVLLVSGTTQLAIWAERLDNIHHWNLRARFMENGVPSSPVLELSSDALNWRPDACWINANIAMVVYEEKLPGGRFRIVARKLSRDGWQDAAIIRESSTEDAMRPAIAFPGNGGVWIAWDETRQNAGNAVYFTRVNAVGGIISAPRLLTANPATNLAAAITVDKQGRPWFACHCNRSGEDGWDIPRWIDLYCLDGDQIKVPATQQLGRDLARQGTDQSFEFPRLLTAPSGAIVVTGRPSHNFCIQSFGNDWSPLYRLPRDGWGGRGQFLEGAFDSKGMLWVVRRDLNSNILHRIDGFPSEPVSEFPLRNVAIGGASAILKGLHTRAKWDPITELEGIDTPLQAAFGDLHGHSWHSDGLNDVDEYYHMRRDLYADDFGSLTDHDAFVRKSIPPSSWELMKVITEHWHEDGRFVTLFGQEYTTGRVPAGIGHKCVFTTDPETPLFDHTLPDADSSQKLNALVRQWNGIMIPHHTGWTGSDWENAEDDIQPLIEVVSAHGRCEFMGNLPLRHRGGMKGHMVQDALAKGHRLGIIGGSDFHGLIWHHRICWKHEASRAGLAGVYTKDLTRDGIMEALKKRRTFGTTGIKPLIDFRVNGHLMGEEIARPADERLRLSVHVATRGERIRYLTIVKNNKDWNIFGGEGLESRYTFIDDAPEPGVNWYYLRAEFETGDMAWSSPVWVV